MGCRFRRQTKAADLADKMLLRHMRKRIGVLRAENDALRQELKSYRHVSRDTLTGLPNRIRLHEALQGSIKGAAERSGKAAVLLLDLDRFKIINETLGHKIGDHLLSAVARRLVHCVGDADMICRLGGDEFLILLGDIDQQEDAVAMARLVLEEIAKPYLMDGFELFVTASIGISSYPSDGDDADSLLKNAESAMYRAKEHGKNNYQEYNETINASLIWRLALENRLRRAVENEEFILYYQPQVDVATGCITGMEALVRWQNPEMGVVSPAQFIPLAEETGLIVPLGEWVLRTACTQSKKWQEEGLPPLRISVNLSARQFEKSDLLDTIRAILQETGLDASGLALELTESIVMRNPDKTIAVLNKLRQMGITISIDDFGTGYSSLSYLKRFPIDTLKIDKSFIDGITLDGGDAAIATAIVRMAQSLNMKVIAEGVEKVEQLDFLRSIHCDGYQGYLFSRPLTSEDLLEAMKAAHWRIV